MIFPNMYLTDLSINQAYIYVCVCVCTYAVNSDCLSFEATHPTHKKRLNVYPVSHIHFSSSSSFPTSREENDSGWAKKDQT